MTNNMNDLREVIPLPESVKIGEEYCYSTPKVKVSVNSLNIPTTLFILNHSKKHISLQHLM